MESPLRVGLLADTHVPLSLPHLPASVRAALGGVDHLVHAGDLVALDVLDDLNAIAPTTAVVGNCDPPEVAGRLPVRTTFALAGQRIGVAHGHQRPTLQNQYVTRGYDAPEFDLFYQAMATQLPECNVIVFGHFHAPVVKRWNGILFVNPGSVAPPHMRPTCAVLELGATAAARIVLLDEVGTRPRQ